MDTDGVFINIHSIIPSSGVNGPGSRMVVFFRAAATTVLIVLTLTHIHLRMPASIYLKRYLKNIYRKILKG